MTTPTVYEWPHEWYQYIITQSMNVRSASLTASRAYIGAVGVKGPHAQFWLNNVTLAPIIDPLRQDMAAFFARLGGQSGLLRISDATRLEPWHDRDPSLTLTTEEFTDSTEFTDGTGFASGYLPPEVFVYQAANRGDNYFVLGGFPASTANVLRRGDLIQIKPGGVPGTFPHLYQAMYGGSSDSSGRVGVEISPRLRAGIAAGDAASLRYPSSVFRFVDDTQAEFQMSTNRLGSAGFQLVEALDQVP